MNSNPDALLAKAYAIELTYYERAKSVAHDVVISLREGVTPTDRLHEMNTILNELKEIQSTTSELKSEWQQSSRAPSETLRRNIVSVRTILEELQKIIVESESLAIQGVRHLSPQLDEELASKKMQKAYSSVLSTISNTKE